MTDDMQQAIDTTTEDVTVAVSAAGLQMSLQASLAIIMWSMFVTIASMSYL